MNFCTSSDIFLTDKTTILVRYSPSILGYILYQSSALPMKGLTRIVLMSDIVLLAELCTSYSCNVLKRDEESQSRKKRLRVSQQICQRVNHFQVLHLTVCLFPNSLIGSLLIHRKLNALFPFRLRNTIEHLVLNIDFVCNHGESREKTNDGSWYVRYLG